MDTTPGGGDDRDANSELRAKLRVVHAIFEAARALHLDQRTKLETELIDYPITSDFEAHGTVFALTWLTFFGVRFLALVPGTPQRLPDPDLDIAAQLLATDSELAPAAREILNQARTRSARKFARYIAACVKPSSGELDPRFLRQLISAAVTAVRLTLRHHAGDAPARQWAALAQLSVAALGNPTTAATR